ncbi:hypothetical protein NDU88_001058 [Pleurodeles waltl]|uniref:Uncharacterized protein n=1 Tax=Pleurodeles waltl TaxID=8319 RepID=A0AAV7N9Q5_PLEWA|nr:hypothetical protein NDU88_001058 [Pleurodeles waltl]
MDDAKVQEALRLLREAGCLNLLQGGMGGPLRPLRRASSGVAAAVLACSASRSAAGRQLKLLSIFGGPCHSRVIFKKTVVLAGKCSAKIVMSAASALFYSS